MARKKAKKPVPFRSPDDVIEYLRDEVIDCATNSELRRLAQLSGVTYAWLHAFRHGRMKDPGYTKVAKLLPWIGVNLSYRVGRHFAVRP